MIFTAVHAIKSLAWFSHNVIVASFNSKGDKEVVLSALSLGTNCQVLLMVQITWNLS